MVEYLKFEDSSFESNFIKILDKSNFCSPFYSSIAQNYFSQRPKDEGSLSCEKSFLLLWEKTPVIAFRGVTLQKKRKTDLLAFEMPSVCLENKIFLNSSIRKFFIKKLDKILNEINGCFWYRDFLFNGELSFLSSHLLMKGAVINPVFSRIIDLSSDKSLKKSSVRKSYKSLINWGIRELQPQIFDKSNISWERMNDFRLLHIRVSGKETRSKESWYKQFEMIEAGQAFLVLGSIEGELVSGGLFTYSKTNCYYQVSASRRDMFEKPLFHSLMWTAINHAKKLNCLWFEIGEQLYKFHNNDGAHSKKELSISDFKAGFGGETKVFMDLKLDQSLISNA
jgi:hypothetical protein